MSATNPEATAGPSQITITVRRPRVAVGAVLWTGIMLSAVLALTYTHSFANYGRPDARVEDEDRGAPITRTHGDLSDAGEDDDDRDEEVDDDEDEGEEEDEEASLNKTGWRETPKNGRPTS